MKAKTIVSGVSVSAMFTVLVMACSSSSSSSSSGTGGSSTTTTSTTTGASMQSGAGTGGGMQATAICPGGPYGDPLPKELTAKKVQGGFKFVEGPVWFAELGALFFSDMDDAKNQAPLNGPKSVIHKFTPPDKFEVFIEQAGSNGLGISNDGKIIACTHDTRSLSIFDPKTKQRSMVVSSYMGKKFNSPNDVAVRSDGNIYFSDPDWQLSEGTPSELPMAVYRVSPKGEVNVVDATLDKPNGVTLSPDELTLYVNSLEGKVRTYKVASDGSTEKASEFATVVNWSDGMTVDCAGNLYVSGEPGVVVFSPKGDKLGTIAVPESATNVAFGGALRKTLYITASDSLFAIDLNIPGYPY